MGSNVCIVWRVAYTKPWEPTLKRHTQELTTLEDKEPSFDVFEASHSAHGKSVERVRATPVHSPSKQSSQHHEWPRVATS